MAEGDFYISQLKGITPITNRSAFIVDVKSVTTAGTAVRLPDVKIPDGFFAIIMARPDNNDSVYIGQTKAIAEAHLFELQPGDSVPYPYTNLNLTWIDADNDGEGISFWVPQ